MSKRRVDFGIALRAALIVAAMLCCGAAANAAKVCDAKAYGAKADGTTKDTKALQAAIDACEKRGGGIVRLSSGTFLTAPIVLKSHITLEVDPGATLLGSQDKTDYPDMQELRENALQPLISATNAEDITIRGGGTIDGNGKPWWDAVYALRTRGGGPGAPPAAGAPADAATFQRSVAVAARRPRLLVLDHCKHVLIDGVTIQNSPSWQVVPYYSDDVTIRNGKILAPARSPNTDGIDPFSSTNVTISHMTIDVGDDNVAIKSGQPGSAGPDSPSRNITVTDCTFLHGHGMSIGSEISGGVQDVHVARVSFKDTDQGVRVKSNRDRGGDIGNFDFRDLTMENVGTPILITEYYPRIPDHDTAQPVTRLTPHFHDINITNVTATGSKTAGEIIGLPESPITTITLTNVHISAPKGMTISDATVNAHDFTVTPESGDAIILLENAKVNQQ
ncbi:MAG: glycoside hydrolase family 28 protein [Candidatus Acidiferrales bacterium]